MEKRNKTMTVQARVDVIALALVAEHFYRLNGRMMSKSEIVNSCVKTLVEILIENDVVKRDLVSVTDAVEVLRHLTSTQKSLETIGRGKRKLTYLLAQESEEITGSEGYIPIRTTSEVMSESDMKRLHDAAQQHLDDQEIAFKKKEEQKRVALKQLGVRPDDNG
jgi:hypothetical protein